MYKVAVYGQTSAQIKVAQRILRTTVDGQFGPMTFAKLAAWQRGQLLPVTGVLDKATWRRMTGR